MKNRKLTKKFFEQNLDLFFDAYFDSFCKQKNVEVLILQSDFIWKNFISDQKNLSINLDYLQTLFINELKIWRKDFTQYFA